MIQIFPHIVSCYHCDLSLCLSCSASMAFSTRSNLIHEGFLPFPHYANSRKLYVLSICLQVIRKLFFLDSTFSCPLAFFCRNTFLWFLFGISLSPSKSIRLTFGESIILRLLYVIPCLCTKNAWIVLENQVLLSSFVLHRLSLSSIHSIRIPCEVGSLL